MASLLSNEGFDELFMSRYLSCQMFPESKNLLSFIGHPMAIAEPMIPLIDIGLELQSQVGFRIFDEQKRSHFPQKRGSQLATHRPTMKRFMLGIGSRFSSIQTASEEFVHQAQRTRISHGDPATYLHNFSGAGLPTLNTNIAFPIEQSSSISNGHNSSQVIDEKMANSVEVRCPANHGAEGQYRAKQGESLGVCREHVPSPEGKICSDLGGNVERLAEMTSPVHRYAHPVSVHEHVTACNTNYLELVVHQDADLEVMDQRVPINQDGEVVPILWMGNLTCSNRHQQGVAKA